MIYFVATPIGNLEDITIRALETLKKSDVIACEDTRTTKKLLDYYNIEKKLISYHKFNENSRVDEIIQYCIEGKEISIVSDAGMPGISDPGNILINKLIENNIQYTVLPGATAFTTALVLSGFYNIKFSFLGFLPTKGKDRNNMLKEIKENSETVIFYESPHRIENTLKDLAELNPNRRVAVVREISKIFEEVIIFEAKDYEKQKITTKGEFVVLLDRFEETNEITDDFIIQKIIENMSNGETKKMAVKKVSELYNLSKNKVYDLSLKI